jgi:hypothetical protein
MSDIQPRHLMLPDLQAFQLARNDVLDAFAQVEASVISFICSRGGDVGCPTRPLAQKLETLASLKAGPRLSKAKKQAISLEAQKLAATLPVRADVVHSPLRIVTLDGIVALYVNASASNAQFPVARMLSLKQHYALAENAQAFADFLNDKHNPSSPTQRKSATATSP